MKVTGYLVSGKEMQMQKSQPLLPDPNPKYEPGYGM